MLIVSFLLGFIVGGCLMFGFLFWLGGQDIKQLSKSDKEILRDYLEQCYGDQ